ncbi:MAG TPA: phytase [Bacteroides sp.]|nr:phytase [Bacteroides sp.]
MFKISMKIASLVLIVVFKISPSFCSDIAVTCAASGIGDQDDMCIWLHPDNPALSTIITSDKDKSTIFVYALDGSMLYSYPGLSKPGNIDIIYNFPFNGELIDIVGFNKRATINAGFIF